VLPAGGEEERLAGREAQEGVTVSVLTEVTPLEGIDLEGSPPCEAVMDSSGRTCGGPGEIRVTSSCCSCRGVISGFFCTFCWSYLRLFIMFQEWACASCGMSREIRES
jgi:hypothetical protein